MVKPAKSAGATVHAPVVASNVPALKGAPAGTPVIVTEATSTPPVEVAMFVVSAPSVRFGELNMIHGVPVALGEPAERQLETLYEQGVEDRLPAHDARILAYFKIAAAEGQVRPRIALARFYARGLGVPKDVARALGLLRATPHEDAQRLLRELSAASP